MTTAITPEPVQEQDLIPEMPAWFREYVQSLPEPQADELYAWLQAGDFAVVETMLDAFTKK
jgi:hypothetical protein